ncbi:hypothetical protein C8F01DRAFT_975612 [Mycena amicta]|nr:hypothetical protein C8F01DRAFT_975612 [Mycena amicta]
MSEVLVSKILVHPIKSCRGISVDHARVTPEGLEYDRLWCVVDEDSTIITARESPKMILITSEILEDLGVLSVSPPGCETFSIPLKPGPDVLGNWRRIPKVMMYDLDTFGDGYVCQSESASASRSPSAILSEYFGRPVHLVYKGPQARTCEPTATHPDLNANAVFQDCYPLMILSEESTMRIEEELRSNHIGKQGVEERWRTEKLVIERFRPNIVFRGAGAFAEDNWQQIRIGSTTISLVSKCLRCLLPNVSPETGERDKAVPYKIIMKFRTGLDPQFAMKPCVGINGVALGDGEIRVGQRVVF